jgi:hypothetical protein
MYPHVFMYLVFRRRLTCSGWSRRIHVEIWICNSCSGSIPLFLTGYQS